MVRLYKFYTTCDTKFTQEQSKCRVYNNASNSRRFRSDIVKILRWTIKKCIPFRYVHNRSLRSNPADPKMWPDGVNRTLFTSFSLAS